MPNPTWLSRTKCALCKGKGRTSDRLCRCVLRRAFRVCLDRFHACGDFSTASGWQHVARSAEYRADFLLVIRRALDPEHTKIFDLRFMAELDWNEGAQLARMDRGNFFHYCYRVEERAGQALLHDGIFPPDKYFDGARRETAPTMTLRTRGLNSQEMRDYRGPGVIDLQYWNWGGPALIHTAARTKTSGKNLGPWPSRIRIPLREKARAAA